MVLGQFVPTTFFAKSMILMPRVRTFRFTDILLPTLCHNGIPTKAKSTKVPVMKKTTKSPFFKIHSKSLLRLG